MWQMAKQGLVELIVSEVICEMWWQLDIGAKKLLSFCQVDDELLLLLML